MQALLIKCVFVCLVFVQAVSASTQEEADAPQRLKKNIPTLQPQLKFYPKEHTFRLTLKNRSLAPLAVLRWDFLYEVALYDDHNRKLSNHRAYVNRGDAAMPGELSWVVLRPEDEVTFPVYPYSAKAIMKVEKSMKWAECVPDNRQLFSLRLPNSITGFKQILVPRLFKQILVPRLLTSNKVLIQK